MTKRLVIGAVGLAILVVALLGLPVRSSLALAIGWIAAHREIAWVVFIGLYALATVALVPGLLLTVAAGAIFGLTRGVVLVSIGSVAGATAAFFVGRTVARDWVRAKIAAWPRFRGLDRALAERGFWVVLLTRLSPAFPFILLNYAYGVTSVRPGSYVVASWIGMLPATVLYVYAGSLAANLTQAIAGDVHPGPSRWILLGVGLLATVAVSVLVARLATRSLDAEIAPTVAGGPP